MKLLLTSAGITNDLIAASLRDLLGKDFSEATIAFIPTASNYEIGDKNWVIKDLVQLQKLGFKNLLITDIAAIDEDLWKPSLESADILFFEGGNEFHLMEKLISSRVKDQLPEMLKSKIYVGLSAGSMVACHNLSVSISQRLFESDFDRNADVPGLGYVDFYVLPHLNSQYFPHMREETVRQACTSFSEKIYVLDDQSAVVVDDDKITVVTEGKWFEIN